MAAPAAILSILVEAQTSKATASLRTLDKNLHGAGTRTDDLDKRTRTLGSTLGAAARYAAGAAAAYVGIAQAKAAVTTTQDLAKTTAGLNRNLGLSVKRASEWGTVAKARDIDSKSLTMSFTTLSRRITDLSKGSAEAKDSFADIGITQKQLESTNGNFNDQVLLIADAFGKAEGGAVRQQAAQKLLGRGYQTILPLFAEGSKSLQEQTEWAEKYGTTLNQKTLKSQMDLISAQRESRVAWMGIQTAFAKFVTPALEVANKEFQKVARILGSDKLSNAEKFKRVGDIIAKWGDKAFDAFVAILPVLAEKAGEAGPKIAGALARGFLNSDIWGKLFIGTWLLKAMGGLSSFRTSGSTAGKSFGRSFAASAGPFLAAAAAFDAIQRGIEFGKSGVVQNQTTTSSYIAEMSDEELKAAWGTSPKGSAAWREIRQELRNRGLIAAQDHQDALDRIRQINERGMGKVNDVTKKALDRMRDNFGVTRQKLDDTTRGQAGDVAGNTNRMVDAVGQGLKTLGSNTNKALSAFGAKKLNFTVDSVGASVAKGMGKQRGGIVVPGSGSGDKVPLQAMVEPGEGVFVLNRNAMGAMQALNSAVPRFQTGGWIDPAGPGTGVVNPSIAKVVGQWSKRYDAAINYGYDPGGGHVSPGHNVTGTATDTGPAAGWTSSATALFEKGLQALVSKGLTVLYGTAGIGTPYPNHGRGNHAHIEWGSNPGKMSFAQNVARMLLGGPDGPLKSMGQGSLDMARKAANAYIRKNSMVTGGGDLSSFGGKGMFSKSALMKLWSSVNGGLASPNLMAAVALSESAGNPKAIGYDPGGTRGLGLWQITTGFNDDLIRKYGGINAMFNPVNNAKAAGEIFQRQGIGAWYGDYQQFLQKGGALPYAGSFDKGGVVPGPVGKPFTATVHGGERITSGAQWERAWKASAEADRERDKEVRDLIRQFVKNQETIMRSGRQEKHAINAAIAAAASGQIGGKVQLESNTPTPGRLASY